MCCVQDRDDCKSKPRSDRVVEIVRGREDDKDSKRDRERERRDEEKAKVRCGIVLINLFVRCL